MAIAGVRCGPRDPYRTPPLVAIIMEMAAFNWPNVLTLEGVAELLAVEPEVIAELASRGELPGRRIGGAWRFARSAVLEWLAAGASGSVPAQSDQ